MERIEATDPVTGRRLTKRTRKGHRFIVVAQASEDAPESLIGFRTKDKANAHCVSLVHRWDYLVAYVVPARVVGA